MSLLSWLAEKNNAGGGHGILFNPIINALTNKISSEKVKGIEEEGDLLRKQIIANALAKRSGKKIIASGDFAKGNQVTEDFYSAPQFAGAPKKVVDLIVQKANEAGIDPLFAGAVAKHESAGTFSPSIESGTADEGIGVFQITPSVGNKYVDNLTPEQRKDLKNQIEIGIKTLADAVRLGEKRFGNDPDPLRKYKDAYMIFNAGPEYLNSKTSLPVLRQRASKVLDYFTEKK